MSYTEKRWAFNKNKVLTFSVNFWCLLAILSLPLNYVIEFTVAGIHLNLIEFLVPFQFLLFIALAAQPSLKIPKYQLYTGLVLFFLLFYQTFALIWIQGTSPGEFIKIALGQIFVFLTYIFFSRISPRLIPFYLELLVWMGGLVTLGTIGLVTSRDSGRLDSPFWGRTNAFAAALLILVLLGIIIVILFRRKIVSISIGINFAGILLTQSRGAFLVLLFVLGLLWFVHAGWRGKIIMPILVVLTALSLWGAMETPTIRNRISTLARLDQEVTAIKNFITTRSDFDKREIMSGRLYVWSSAVEVIAQNPLFGSAERPVYIPRWAGSQSRPIDREGFSYHSWLLNITARYGFIGMGLNLFVLIAALSPYWKYRKRQKTQLFLLVLSAPILHGLIEPIFEGGFLASNISGLLFWMIAGLGYGVIIRPPKHTQSSYYVVDRVYTWGDKSSLISART